MRVCFSVFTSNDVVVQQSMTICSIAKLAHLSNSDKACNTL